MKKKITALLLVLLAVLPIITACGDNTEDNETGRQTEFVSDTVVDTEGDAEDSKDTAVFETDEETGGETGAETNEETDVSTDTNAESDTESSEETADEDKPVIEEDSDNYAGTPAYTVSGDYIIVNGKKYPNDKNYTQGPLVAVDDTGRILQTAEGSKNYVSSGKYVGLFYFQWLGEHTSNGNDIYDMSKILAEGGTAALSPYYSGWGPKYAAHFWGEPLYGYYYSTDTWVMRKHIEQLTNAGVDFLYFDVTNGYTYTANVKAILSIIDEYIQDGWDAPQVVFYTHTNSGLTVQKLYNSIYSKNYCPDTWFRIDGKPVIIAYEDEVVTQIGKKAASTFTFRVPQWPNTSKKEVNAWPWMSFFRWDSDIFYNTKGEAEAINVSVAQHCDTGCFSDSVFYPDTTKNRGRSYHNGDYSHTANSYKQGYNFQEQWDAAIEANVPYILVTGWNEWIADRQPGKQAFIDTINAEFSRDIEMMKGGYFDNYYMQLIYNIRRYKGVAPTLVQNTRKKIDVNGSFSQWDDVLVTYNDPKNDTVDRNSTAYGDIKLTDTTGRNDLYAMKVICDTKYAYFYAELAEDSVTSYDTKSSWMQLFINTDNKASSGWYGYDYIVNYKAKSDSSTSVAKYSGSNNSFKFTESATVNYKVEGNKIMIAVPLSDLGITDYQKIKFSFKWVDSDNTVTEMEQMYTNGDSAPHGRLNYLFQNYK